MIRLAVALLTCVCLRATASEYSFQIFPEVRIGPITKSTTKADLVVLFGRESVTDGDVYVGEGEYLPGTFVYKDDPARVLAILWAGSSADAHPKTVRICADRSTQPCRWRMDSGVTLGSTLKELERLNGRPFRLAGFSWDYEGTVKSWAGGGFPAYSSHCDRLLLRLRVDVQPGQPDNRDWLQVLGAREYSSGHPAVQRLNPRVYSMLVDFDTVFAPGCGPINASPPRR